MRQKLIIFVLGLITIASAWVVYGSTLSPNSQTQAVGSAGSMRRADPRAGPLRVHPANPRYFTNGSGEVIYLTGSHTWSVFQDSSDWKAFDYTAYLDFLQAYNHNFIRMWVAPPPTLTDKGNWVTQTPLLYRRTGPGLARDGGLKYDVTQFDQRWFDRLRSRVMEAGERGIFVMVMLYRNSEHFRHRWEGHPFHRDNNINGIDGDPNHDGLGKEVQQLSIAAVTALQEAYVRRVVDTLNDLDNVIYEIANESEGGAENTSWQYHQINYIHRYESSKPKQHPVVMTSQWPSPNNAVLFASPAEGISPFGDTYRDDPAAADGTKVIIADTDHLGGSVRPSWVWKSFVRGLHPILMDWYDKGAPHADWYSIEEQEAMRKNMGHTLSYARRMNLASMVPRTDVASSGYCLANLGTEYLIYLPSAPHRLETWLAAQRYIWRLRPWVSEVRQWFRLAVSVDLGEVPVELRVEWFNPSTGQLFPAGTIHGGSRRTFRVPFRGDAVLYMVATTSESPQ